MPLRLITRSWPGAVAARSEFESAASGAVPCGFSRVVSVCMGVSTFSMFVWAPSRCPPFRPEALQPTGAGYNNFGTVGSRPEYRFLPKFWASSLGSKPDCRGACNGLQHPYRSGRFDLETMAIRRGRSGLGGMRCFSRTKARKALELSVRLVFGFWSKTLHVGFFTRRATR